MIKFIETIYSFNSEVSKLHYAAHVIEYKGCNRVVVDHEGDMFILCHFVGEDIRDCMMPASDKVIECINNNVGG